MRELFVNVLNTSFYGSIIIGAVILLRFMLSRVPKKYICLLWLLAGLRLLMPFNIESNLSLQPQAPLSEGQWIKIESFGHILESEEVVEQPVRLTPEEAEPLNATQPPLSVDVVVETSYIPNWPALLPCLWLIGIGIMGLYTVISCLRLRRRVKDSIILSEGVWISGKLDSAFVLGIFHPQIYLSAGLTEEEQMLVLAHEQCHVRRGDHIWKLLGFAVLAVHWFNPLVWAAYVLLCRDMEMACDEAVVKDMDAAQRKEYSAALLACGTRGHSIAACPVAFGEVSVKQRIHNVLRYRKPSFWMGMTAVIAIVVLAVCFVTTPAKDSPSALWEIQKVENVTVSSIIGIYSPGTYAEVQEVAQMLGTVRLGEKQEMEAPMEEVWIELEGDAAVDTICFAQNHSLIWGRRGEENTAVYSVENPEVMGQFQTSVYNGAKWLHPSAAPFANVDEPAKWAQGITMDAVAKAGVAISRSSENYGSTKIGVLPVRRVEKLLTILNGLKEEEFSEQEFLKKQYYHDILAWRYPETCSALIVDAANHLSAVVLISPEGKLELLLVEDTQWLDSGQKNESDVYCYTIEDHSLLSYMRQLRESPSYIMYSTWYQEQMDAAYAAE